MYRINTDKYIFNVKERYIFTLSLFLFFIIRIFIIQGFYVVAYVQGIIFNKDFLLYKL
jgi:hypothetical protein